MEEAARNGSLAGDISMLPSFPMWQLLVFSGAIGWILLSRLLLITPRLRSLLQPLVVNHVQSSIPFMIRLQGMQSPLWDALLASLSFCVSVEFYSGFLPLVFWAGYSRLARHATLLMALCLYLGNSVKDIVSAPRPPSPPVRKLLATNSEKESSHEYGLPSSHTINTLCLAGYLLNYMWTHGDDDSRLHFWLAASFGGIVITGVIYGRMYLGMHSPLDVVAGAAMGMTILYFWLVVEDYVDEFIIHGESVNSFWGTLSVILLFAYPSPEQYTPSFEFHTAFNGVAFGVVCGVHRTYQVYHDGSSGTLSLLSMSGE